MNEYAMKEAEFLARTDALCENVSPSLCDCSMCPCADLCKWLCDNVSKI